MCSVSIVTLTAVTVEKTAFSAIGGLYKRLTQKGGEDPLCKIFIDACIFGYNNQSRASEDAVCQTEESQIEHALYT